jgi:hypothetical protein
VCAHISHDRTRLKYHRWVRSYQHAKVRLEQLAARPLFSSWLDLLSLTTGLNFPRVRSLPERFQRCFSAIGRVRSLLTGLAEHPVALAHERNTDWTLDRTLDLRVRSSVRSLTVTTKTTISFSFELRFRWSWIFWKAYAEGYTSHIHTWSKSQWIKAVFQIKNYHLVRSTPKKLSLFSKLIKINSNTFSFANVPTSLSVHHHVQVC